MEFVSYNTAKLAKEKGFEGTSKVYYDITGGLYTQTYSDGIGYIPMSKSGLQLRRSAKAAH